MEFEEIESSFLNKAFKESWEAQLTQLDSRALTAWILLNRVLFSLVKGPYMPLNCAVFNQNETYLGQT